jgi:hypothetical protein
VRVPLQGLTYAEAAARIDLEASALGDLYHDGPGVAPNEVIELDVDEVAVVEEALWHGDRALRELDPGHEPTLWPEHFDVGIAVNAVNFGVSPGDGYLSWPYAYVGPHQARTGSFWNAPFGAARPLTELGGVDGIVAFFHEGAAQAAS